MGFVPSASSASMLLSRTLPQQGRRRAKQTELTLLRHAVLASRRPPGLARVHTQDDVHEPAAENVLRCRMDGAVQQLRRAFILRVGHTVFHEGDADPRSTQGGRHKRGAEHAQGMRAGNAEPSLLTCPGKLCVAAQRGGQARPTVGRLQPLRLLREGRKTPAPLEASRMAHLAGQRGGGEGPAGGAPQQQRLAPQRARRPGHRRGRLQRGHRQQRLPPAQQTQMSDPVS